MLMTPIPLASRKESESLEIDDQGGINFRGTPIGRFHLSSKGYPRFHSGPHRGQYVHRVIAAIILGLSSAREISKSTDIHHHDTDKLNFAPHNLCLIDHRQHGFLTARQSWFIRHILDPQRKLFFDEVNGLDAHLDDETVVDVTFDIGDFAQ